MASTLKEQLAYLLQQIETIGGDARPLVFAEPAHYNKVHEIEQQLGGSMPDDFKNVLINLSSHCEFKWFLPSNFKLPVELGQLFCGDLHWGLDFVLDFNRSKDIWVEKVFSDPENEYDKIWHNKFVFQEVGNGDYISIDLAPDNYGKIIYLSHDDGVGHGCVMANSFPDLVARWTRLGCVGGEDWQWLPFCENKIGGIDPTCVNARLWQKAIGLA